jgi:hypothetical protein
MLRPSAFSRWPVPLVARLGLGIAALGMVELSQVIEARGDVGMLRPSAFSKMASARW